MVHGILTAFAAAGLFGLLTSTVFTGMVFAAVLRFRRPVGPGCACAGASAACDTLAPASLLKPLHGAEPGLEAHLESFFRQDYPSYEILFCARSAGDAGLLTAQRVAARFPHVPARFFTSGEPPCANAKIASLALMAKAAAHDLLIVSDSDVLVGPQYLREVVKPFADPRVGAVTCLYRGATPAAEHAGPFHPLWAQLEGVGMSIEMTSGVLVANMLEGMQFLLGPTMAMRRECVEAIGGFASLGEYCSDDFLLGNRIAALGHEVVLSRHVIDHVVLNAGFVASLKHQARWMKSTRFSRPKGHLGTGLIFSVPYALLAAVALAPLGHPWLAASALLWSVGSRMALAALVGGAVLAERHLWRTVLLYPLRDLMGFGFWAASYASNRILWRGEVFTLLDDGLMRPLHARPAAPAGSGNDEEAALSAR